MISEWNILLAYSRFLTILNVLFYWICIEWVQQIERKGIYALFS